MERSVRCMQKKIANVYDMAMKMGAPVIGLIDCDYASAGRLRMHCMDLVIFT